MFPQSSGPLATHRGCSGSGRPRVRCGRRRAVQALCYWLLPRLSETVPQRCPQTVRISARPRSQPARVCCLMRLVSSVTWA